MKSRRPQWQRFPPLSSPLLMGNVASGRRAFILMRASSVATYPSHIQCRKRGSPNKSIPRVPPPPRAPFPVAAGAPGQPLQGHQEETPDGIEVRPPRARMGWRGASPSPPPGWRGFHWELCQSSVGWMETLDGRPPPREWLHLGTLSVRCMLDMNRGFANDAWEGGVEPAAGKRMVWGKMSGWTTPP